MWYPGPKSSRWSSLLVLASLLACENDKPEVPAANDASAPVGDASLGQPADAADLPTRDGATPVLDAGAPSDSDAGMATDASLDGSAGPVDAGTTSDAAVLPFVCNVPAPTSCPTPAPRYPEIAAIIKQRCASCHSPLWTGPWPLDTYRHVADWQDTIQSNMLDCSMPPPDAGVPITLAERVSILTWIRCGLPQ